MNLMKCFYLFVLLISLFNFSFQIKNKNDSKKENKKKNENESNLRKDITNLNANNIDVKDTKNNYKEKSDIKGKVIFKINKKLKNKFLEKHDRKS